MKLIVILYVDKNLTNNKNYIFGWDLLPWCVEVDKQNGAASKNLQIPVPEFDLKCLFVYIFPEGHLKKKKVSWTVVQSISIFH